MSGKYQRNKRKGSKCFSKRPKGKSAAKKTRIWLYWRNKFSHQLKQKYDNLLKIGEMR